MPALALRPAGDRPGGHIRGRRECVVAFRFRGSLGSRRFVFRQPDSPRASAADWNPRARGRGERGVIGVCWRSAESGWDIAAAYRACAFGPILGFSGSRISRHIRFWRRIRSSHSSAPGTPAARGCHLGSRNRGRGAGLNVFSAAARITDAIAFARDRTYATGARRSTNS